MMTNVLKPFSGDPADSIILKSLSCNPILTASLLGLMVMFAMFGIRRRAPFDPLPIIGNLHIFLSRPRWGHLDWFLASSKWHYNASLSKSLRVPSAGEGNQVDGLLATAGLSWNFKIPGMASSVFTCDPACIKHVLVTKAKDFSKAGIFADFTKDMLGRGILVVSGAHWRMQRQAGKLLSLPSTLAYVHDEVVPRCLETMLSRLDEAAIKGDTVEFQMWAKDAAFAIFGPLALETEPEVLLNRLAVPFDDCLVSMADRFANPFWHFTERFTARGQKFRRDLAEIKSVIKELVERALNAVEKSSDKVDVQEHVVAGESKKERRVSLVETLYKAGVTDVNDIVDSCINFALAGRETTAHAMTWTTYQLLENPNILADLRHSLDITSTAVPISSEKSVILALSSHLSTLSDICSESLRLHPPLPTEIVQHVGSSPIALPSGQIVSPGDVITWSPWVMARMPNLWGQTAGDFDPSRWSKMRDQGEKKSVYELPTFHAGPRACLGKDLAKVVMMRTLEAVVRRYDIEGVGERSGRLGVGITGEMEGGLKVRLKLRKGVL